MPRYDFNGPRLYVDHDLATDARVELNGDQANYLRAVLRLRDGDRVLAFNGRDGEWSCAVELTSRKSCALRPRDQMRDQMRDQVEGRALHYLFAPLKHARLDYMAQKAVEMGASHLCPVITRRTQARSVNPDRLRANAIKAAEQCGILQIPEIAPPVALETLLSDWPSGRLLIFCDEDAEVADPIASLRAQGSNASLAVLIGPEGGFDKAERETLRRLPEALVLSLGPRILRADTAAVAALALVQAALGDWR